ncbi:MAG: helix-turn-helix transcriptional regulator [Clostridia bacterium]|nr:helix-turn-helix transcriptional regulator [Clostridia bacterium]
MKNVLYDYGYGSAWTDVHIDRREGYYTSVADYHEHDFYEINLIVSGNVKILLADRSEQGTQNRIVLTKPGTPHFISCNPDTLYSRLYLVFSRDFAENCVPEWEQLEAVFGKSGSIVTITPVQKDFFIMLINNIENEANPFRQKLLVLYLLSCIKDCLSGCNQSSVATPPYIIKALDYINKHYTEKIVASKLAQTLYIGRTTLMTDFKKYTGNTLNGYIVHCRLKNSLILLQSGKTIQQTAELCGFGDSSGLIRCFKKHFGTTPKQYIKDAASQL